METLVAFIITVAVAAFFLRGYLKGLKGRDERAREYLVARRFQRNHDPGQRQK